MSNLRLALRPFVWFVAIGLIQAVSAQTSSSISSNFNGTSISGSDYIWFNAHLTSLTFANEAATASEVTIHISDSTVSFNNNGIDYVVNIPDADLTFSTSEVSATGSFTNGAWEISYPKSSGGNPFLGGVMWDVPAAGLDGGTNPVTWTANFSSDKALVSSLSWQWSAAVYTSAPSDPNQLNVLFLDGGGQSGTPVAYESYVTGGARGGGGSNFTGSNSATGSISNLAVVPEPSTALLGLIGSLCLLRRRRI